MIACRCISHNRPELGGDLPEIVIQAPSGVRISIDRCMEPHLRKLWAAGIETASCCCGHNGQLPRHIVIADHIHLGRARAMTDEGIDVGAWSLDWLRMKGKP